MRRALELGGRAVGLASPNPPVGCVLVKDGAVVGEGFHQYDLRDHAEVVALAQAGSRARGATAYVTLEPCNSTGRTGPCSEALIAAGVSRVVAAMEDPNPKTHGAGLDCLRAAEISVDAGLLQPEAQRLNEGFAKWIVSRKPFVTLKSALTLDGQLAIRPARNKRQHSWITGEEARAEVQRMRHASDALLTGIGTILADDPALTDRSGLPRRRNLLRVVLDSKLRLPLSARMLKSAREHQDLLVFTAASLTSPKARKLAKLGVQFHRVKPRRGRLDIVDVLAELGRREILSVLLEAGPALNASALAAKAIDRLTLFYAPKIAGDSRVPFVHGSSFDLRTAHVSSLRRFGADVAIEIELRPTGEL